MRSGRNVVAVSFALVIVAACSAATQDDADAGSETAIPRTPDANSAANASANEDATARAHEDASADADADADASPNEDASADASPSSDAGPDGGSGPVRVVCPSACGPNEVLCDRRCVSKDDPRYGCGSCTPCSLLHATATCNGGACAVASCDAGFADCDGDGTSCEASLAKPGTCGSCMKACANGERCSAGQCVAACTFPETDCNGACETLATSVTSCGSCARGCGVENGTASCSGGVCKVASCEPGYAACGDTCYATSTDPDRCGPTCRACPVSDTVGELPVCNGGVCGVVCKVGLVRCGSACVSTTSSATNCGACGVTCGAVETCIAGACVETSSVQLVTGLSAPEDIAVDGQNLYVTDPGSDTVWQIDKVTLAKTALGTNQAKPWHVVVDDGYVYWTSTLGGAVLRSPIGGGGATVLYATTSPTALAVDETNVYWTRSSSGAINVAPKGGGGATNTVSITPTFTVAELMVYEDKVWAWGWSPSNYGKGWISRSTLATQRTFSDTHPNSGVAFANGRSWWGRTILANSWLEGPVPVTLGLGDAVHRITSDDCEQYWTTRMNNIMRHRSQSPSAEPLTTAATRSKEIAIDAQYVYWTDTTWVGRVPR